MFKKKSGRKTRVTIVVSLVAVPFVGSFFNPSEAQNKPEWLLVTNRYRASAGLGDVVENLQASAGAVAHSRYLVTNRTIAHDEDRSRPGFSDAGLRAGLTGNVSGGSGAPIAERAAIEGWLGAPFHGVGMLAPTSTAFGYGLSSNKKRDTWATTLSLFWDDYVAEGQDSSGQLAALVTDLAARDQSIDQTGYSWNCRGSNCVLVTGNRVFVTENGRLVEKAGADPVAATAGQLGYDRPVLWPGPDTGVPLTRYSGNEYPNPLASCPGYRVPVGLPIYILRGKTTEITDSSLVDDNGTSLRLCVISAATYRSPQDRAAEETGRAVLESYGAIVFLPKDPLRYGHRYEMKARTTDGESFQWSFRIVSNGAIELPSSHPKANEPTVGRASQPAPVVRAKPNSKAK